MKSKARKIVLYNPNPLSKYRMSVLAPLPLLAISRILDKEGYNIRIVSPCLYKDPVKEVVNSCEDAICLGISCITGYQITDGLSVAKLVRQKYPELPIVWGGWHPSLEPEQTLRSPYVDIVVRGQGERTFTELVHCLENAEPLHNIHGISYKDGDEIFHNPDRPLEDMNNFPPVPYHLVDVKKCLFNTEYGSRVINYITSYGCPFRCSFCEVGTVFKRRWSGLDAKRVVDEMEWLVKNYNVDGFEIHDNSFYVSKKRIRQFCEEIIKRKLKIKYATFGRTDQLLSYPDDLWRLLKKSGLYAILVGAESGFQEMLDFINKDTTVEETIDFAKKCKEHGVKAFFSFFVGIPWDKDLYKSRKLVEKEFKLTLGLIDKLKSMDKRHRILLSHYTPYPGSSLYQRSLECGFKPPDKFEDWSGYLLEHTRTLWMPPEISSLIEQMTTYSFFFMDTESYGWVTARFRSRFIRLILKFAFRIFEKFVHFRWKHRFFYAPIDYKIYRFARDHGRLFGFYES